MFDLVVVTGNLPYPTLPYPNIPYPTLSYLYIGRNAAAHYVRSSSGHGEPRSSTGFGRDRDGVASRSNNMTKVIH